MRAVLSLLVCTACNQWFGLEGTRLEPDPDAQFFDAPPGIPRECPPIGTTPTFDAALHPIEGMCFGLTTTADGTLATAACNAVNGPKIGQGPVEGPFTLVPSLDATAPDHRDWPRLAPEGDELFTREWNTGTTTSKIHAFTRTADSYQPAYTLPTTFDSFDQFGAPSRGPTRRMFVRPQALPGAQEIAIAGGTSTVVRTYTPAELGLNAVYSPPNLVADGLRAVVLARIDNNDLAGVYYLERPTLDTAWSVPKKLVALNAIDPFMTADCGRIYFQSAGTLVYVEAK
jgi:hypothetical protein